MKDKIIYEHLGDDEIDFNYEYEQPEIGGFKPQGLWASPKDSKYNWRNWCKENDFKFESLQHHFEFYLKPYAKILKVDSVDSLVKVASKYKGEEISQSRLPIYNYFSKVYTAANFQFTHYLDFETISKDYDGFEVLISSDPHLYYVMYGYDVDSLIIWNLKVIQKFS